MTTGFDKWKSVEWRNKPRRRKTAPVSRGYHYKLGKICSNCNMPIIDKNTSGYCSKCYQFMRVKGEDDKQQESEEHKSLKQKAAKWLYAIGCKNIKEEHKKIGKLGEVRFDVVGHKDGLLIAVECGGSQQRKLDKVMGITEEIYIWPYGAEEPYKYNKGMRICYSCGNIKYRGNTLRPPVV